MKKIRILILIFIFPSCAIFMPGKTLSNTMQSYVGHHKSELYLKWGAPTRTTSDGKDGEMIIYEYSSRGREGEIYQQGNRTYYTNPQTVSKTRTFYADRNGVIYHWMWNGL